MFLEINMAFQTQTLSSEQLQALFESITAQQSQGDSSFYLPHLRSDQEGETPLDTQLEAEGEAGEDEVVPRISSSSREDRSEKQLEFDKELFLSEVSTNLIAIIKFLERVAANTNYINKVLHGVIQDNLLLGFSEILQQRRQSEPSL